MSSSTKKRFFVCCDGTSRDLTNEQHDAMTNVVRFKRCLKMVADDGALQVVYYRKGPMDAVLGRDIYDVIKDAYYFICDNYNFEEKEKKKKDEIHLVGFSRGAFAVRALACFIGDIGLFSRTGLAFLPYTYQLWRTWRESNEEKQEALKSRVKDYISRGELKGRLKKNVEIKSCAVWDTVRALNERQIKLPSKDKRILMESRDLHYVGGETPERLHNAFQALALNETRYEFTPTLWEKSSTGSNTNIQQCWFRGDHSDIGGGWPDSGLANLTLLWMVSRFKQSLLEVTFDEEILTDFLTPMTLRWSIEKYFEKSHTATEGETHVTRSVIGFSMHGCTDVAARAEYLQKDGTIHPTVRILMAVKDKDVRERRKNNPLLNDYYLVFFQEQSDERARMEWHPRSKDKRVLHEDSATVSKDNRVLHEDPATVSEDKRVSNEDSATFWEGRTFRKWLKREKGWRDETATKLRLDMITKLEKYFQQEIRFNESRTRSRSSRDYQLEKIRALKEDIQNETKQSQNDIEKIDNDIKHCQRSRFRGKKLDSGWDELEKMKKTFAARLYDYRGEVSKPSYNPMPKPPAFPVLLQEPPISYHSTGSAMSYTPIVFSDSEI